MPTDFRAIRGSNMRLNGAGASRQTTNRTVKIGLFGLLGQGNLGNDGSLEAVLAYLARDHPEAILDSMCSGPERVMARYGIPARRLRWCQTELLPSGGLVAKARKSLAIGFGVFADAFRIGLWVGRHDAVIVPGMGVLEVTVPERPWRMPYALLVLSVSGKLFGTKIALVSVGASMVRQPLTRWLLTSAARLAYYRSYRDGLSRQAMSEMRIDTSLDAIYPDLVFSHPAPPVNEAIPGSIGVGVMDYSGGNEDRKRAHDIQAAYVTTMTRFVQWLLDNGRTVRLLIGDAQDERVVAEIMARLKMTEAQRTNACTAEPVSSIADLTDKLGSCSFVVATRFHNVLCALKMGKPTLSIGYSEKFDALMADMGLTEFSLSVKSIEHGDLVERFTALERQSDGMRSMLEERSAAKAQLLEKQFGLLTELLFGTSSSHGVSKERERGSRDANWQRSDTGHRVGR